MAAPIISVRNLGKRYVLGATLTHDTLRDHLAYAAQSFVDAIRGTNRNGEEETIGGRDNLWALQEVSFDVDEGEVIGIIGRNGAGKSTLLKILSQITEPTIGEIGIRGRVASLLEVGTGFHPELTGRENVFLNGAILGMSRQEIKSKFDEIVAFSEVERFLDTPVKRYSSGMHVRLAFAVAAHLEPEILIVDEVLAVGDFQFQKKCLGKMGDVARQGRTVLFVSHNMVAVQSLCRRALWLQEGRMIADGETDQVTRNYLQMFRASASAREWQRAEQAPGNDIVRLRRVRVGPEAGGPDPITMQTPVRIEIEYWNQVRDAHLHVTLHVTTEQGIVAFGASSVTDAAWHERPFPVGLFRSVCHIPGNLMNSGLHQVTLLMVKDRTNVVYRHEDVISFTVVDSPESRGGWYGKLAGVVRPRLEWTTEPIDLQEQA